MLEPGSQKLAAIPAQLSTLEYAQRYAILQAKQFMLSGDPEAALDALPDPNDVEAPLHRARLFETRAQSFHFLQDPDNELIARIDLESQLSDQTTIDKNHQQIWQMLRLQSVSTLGSLTTNVRGDTYQGWIELALANTNGAQNDTERSGRLRQWQSRFTNHPANARFVPTLFEPGVGGGFAPDGGPINQIAVLLPLSAQGTANASAAIRDGLVTAYQHASTTQVAPSLRFYDIGANSAYARNAYQNAINDGADAVIGPLRKQAVSAIVTQRQIPVPTLTLNTVDLLQTSEQTKNVLQFGLAPEDEARSAASRAIALSLNTAIILQSDDSRGDREARAFQETMFNYGGDVAHIAILPKDEYDYSEQIRDALQISQSDQRFRSLSNAIGQKLFFEPSIRDDVDVVFLAITSDQARSVRPQLDFFHARELPRFATSRVASLDDDARKNKDLNSIFYADAPWVLNKRMRKDPLKQTIEQNFPQSKGVYGKLYALGIDAYRIMLQLDALSQGERLTGYTGDLELTGDGRVQRHLDWAQYQEGKSVGVKRFEAEPLQSIRSRTIN
jgi:outer membrane PBP1 activator LpoA protein